MKRLAVVLSVLFVVFLMTPDVEAGWVNGYYRSDGTYVNGYYRSDANGLLYDNYSWNPSQPLYNDSYNDSSYSSDWYTPSWQTQDDYWTGLNYYDDYNDYNGYWSDYDYYNW